MKTMLRTVALSAVVLGLVTAATPAYAQAPQATFYEVTENMRLIAKGKPRRVAHSALIGTADIGTPFCPTALVRAVSATAMACSLNAIGEDDISLVTGLGTFDAKLTVVVQGDNPIDPPEYVIAKLRASGKMNFAPAILQKMPYGTITGRTHIVGADDTPVPFTGVFRLPFLGTVDGARAALCPGTGPNTQLPAALKLGDVAYLDTLPNGQPTGCLDIQLHELSLGWPAVRFDLWF